MGVYPEVIRQALIMFPFLAFLITLPYMIYNYRKYGSVLGIRILVVYSFALYLLCIYFLVILPLPSMEEVSQMTGRRAQLIPFHFLVDILKEADIVPGNICSLFSVLNEALFQVLFNVLMIVPFGIYLRYYFRCGLKRTVLFSFFLSLFFELTQLSGLYFIYPRGYRLFDVDDLIANTAGGALGYFIIQPFLKFLPSREKMDRASYGRGRRVSLSRRIFSLLTDGVCILVLYGICALICGRAGIALPGYIPALLVWSYFSLMTLLTGGKTVGKWLTRTCVAENSGKKICWYQYFLRYGLLWGFFLLLPEAAARVRILLERAGIAGNAAAMLFSFLEVLFYLVYMIYGAVQISRQKQLFYEKWSATRIVSTVREPGEP